MGGEESDECRPAVRDGRPRGFERLFPLPVGVRHVRRIVIMLPLGATDVLTQAAQAHEWSQTGWIDCIRLL